VQVLLIYGKRALQMEAGPDPYSTKYKGIWVCFMILARALGGNYVMCGVFELYGDPSLTVLPHLSCVPPTKLKAPIPFCQKRCSAFRNVVKSKYDLIYLNIEFIYLHMYCSEFAWGL